MTFSFAKNLLKVHGTTPNKNSCIASLGRMNSLAWVVVPKWHASWKQEVQITQKRFKI